MVDERTREYLRELTKAMKEEEADKGEEIVRFKTMSSMASAEERQKANRKVSEFKREIDGDDNSPIGELWKRTKALESTFNNWESLVAKEAKRMEKDGFVSERQAHFNKLMALRQKILGSPTY